MDLRLDVLQLLHQLFVDVQASGSIQDDDVVAVVLGVLDCVFGNLHRTDGAHLKDRCIDLCSDYLQLLDSSRAVNVTGNQQRAFALLAEHPCQLCRVGGLTGTLQAAHHNDGRKFGRKIDAAVGRTHQLGQLIAHNLDDLLCRSQTGKDLFADRFFGDVFDKVLGYLIIDVRFQQCEADLTHCFLYIILRKLSL